MQCGDIYLIPPEFTSKVSEALAAIFLMVIVLMLRFLLSNFSNLDYSKFTHLIFVIHITFHFV